MANLHMPTTDSFSLKTNDNPIYQDTAMVNQACSLHSTEALPGGEEPNNMQVRAGVFTPSSSEEAMDIGFVREVKRLREMVDDVPSSSTCKIKTELGRMASTGGERVISFALHPSFPDDADLLNHFRDEKSCSVARYIRDLEVVTAYHVNELISKDALFPCSVVDTTPLLITPPHNVLTTFKLLIERIRGMESILRETLNTGRVNENLQILGSANQASDNDLFDAPWPNFHSGIYVSKLITRYSMMHVIAPPREIEVADYCLALNNHYSDTEPFFRDISGLTVVRKHIRSLDIWTRVHPIVVNAFARVLTHSWNMSDIKWRTTLDVVSKDKDSDMDANLVNHWITWVRNSGVALKEAVLVTIPLHMGGDYCLLVVDFRSHQVQLIDSVLRENRRGWEEFAATTLRYFSKLLLHRGDKRGLNVNDFHFSVVHTPGSSKYDGTSTGIVTMHLMHLVGDESHPLETFELTQEFTQISLRVIILDRIVTSKVNNLGNRVLSHVRAFVQQKLIHHLYPSPQLQEWLRMYTALIQCSHKP